MIKGESVAWEPALDRNRVILGGQLVARVRFRNIRAVIARRSDWHAAASS